MILFHRLNYSILEAHFPIMAVVVVVVLVVVVLSQTKEEEVTVRVGSPIS